MLPRTSHILMFLITHTHPNQTHTPHTSVLSASMSLCTFCVASPSPIHVSHSCFSGSKMDEQLSDSEEMVTAIDDVTTEDEPQEPHRPSSRRKMSMKSADEDTEQAEPTPLTPMLVRHGRSNSETPPMQTKRSSGSTTERTRRSRSIGKLMLIDAG